MVVVHAPIRDIVEDGDGDGSSGQLLVVVATATGHVVGRSARLIL